MELHVDEQGENSTMPDDRMIFCQSGHLRFPLMIGDLISCCLN